ncbi:hypothetical protein Daus18300_000032 [Diaporthe australafricana]|uniref:Uncharacterized protein n=1 Tax=Diaporthe australafricana TaxID=127596 RepID=A0ABR3Y897_9PEZI
MDRLDPQEPKATADIPLLEGTRLQWTKSLLRGDSYYSMSMLIYKLGEEAAQLPGFLVAKFNGAHRDADQDDDCLPDEVELSSPEEEKPSQMYKNRTERLLKTAMDGRRNFMIFQTLPRDMLESIVLGTVAWDYHPRRSHGNDGRGGYERPEKGGYGIYAFGLAGRKVGLGELKVLVKNLKSYILGYMIWDQHGESWPNDSKSRSSRDLVQGIDSKIGKHTDEAPRFITSNDGKKGMLDLVRSLQRRVDKSLELDPMGDTPMIQTPVYVGLSNQLADTMPKHDPTSRKDDALKNSNKAHGLVCSLVKLQGLEPEAVCRVALLLWDKDDLWLGETLDGLNRTECGSRVRSNAPPLDRDAEEFVKIHHAYHFDNLEATLNDLQERKAFIDEFGRLQSVLNDDVVEKAKRARAESERLGLDMSKLREIIKKGEAKLELGRKKVKAVQETMEILDCLEQIKAAIDLDNILGPSKE